MWIVSSESTPLMANYKRGCERARSSPANFAQSVVEESAEDSKPLAMVERQIVGEHGKHHDYKKMATANMSFSNMAPPLWKALGQGTHFLNKSFEAPATS